MTKGEILNVPPCSNRKKAFFTLRPPPNQKMPEARDRVERPVDYSAIFANRRSRGVLLDEPASRLSVFEHRVQRLPSGSQVDPQPGSLIGTGGVVRGNYSSWRPGNGIGSGRSPFRLSQGRQNLSMASARRGRGGASGSLLPSWYPRKPLRDVTHIMRAIERKRRAGLEAATHTHLQVRALETPAPAVGLKRSCPLSTANVHKMLLDNTKKISEEEEAEAGFITPEKKLLNSIDIVEKIVMAEIQKLRSTPLAKREEREKRVKTLMSMR